MNVNAARPHHPIWAGGLARNLGEWSAATDTGARSTFLNTKTVPDIFPVATEFELLNSNHVDTIRRSAIHADFERGLASVAMVELFAKRDEPCEIDTDCHPNTNEGSDDSEDDGPGSVLLCGLGVVQRVVRDPVAAKLLSNLAMYTAQSDGHEAFAMIDETNTIVWGDYASESGVISGTRNGLLVHTTKVDVQGAKGAKEFQIVPSGRELADFYYSSTCHVDDAQPSNNTASAVVFLRLNAATNNLTSTMTTFVHNPSDQVQSIAVDADGFGGDKVAPVDVPAKTTVDIVSNVAVGVSKEVQISFVGGKGMILVNTTFS